MRMKFTSTVDQSIGESTRTVYADVLDELNTAIAIETRKYPLTDREKLFADILKRTLVILDDSCRWR